MLSYTRRLPALLQERTATGLLHRKVQGFLDSLR